MNKLIRSSLVFSLAISLASGCTTFRPLNTDSRTLAESVQAGDSVRITDRKGVITDMVVQEFRDSQIIGTREKVAVPDIATIEKREYSPGRTAGLIVVGASATVVVILGALFLFFAPMAGP